MEREQLLGEGAELDAPVVQSLLKVAVVKKVAKNDKVSALLLDGQ